jgi:threonine aldolase
MPPPTRRAFLQAGAACAALSSGRPFLAAAGLGGRADEPAGGPVDFRTDGLMLSPADYARLLARLADGGRAGADVYLAGGCVAELEARFARLLGKEQAVFVPTGTLANHLALRSLAGGKERVLVPAESHIYCDAFDCVQGLSHLNLVPLGAGRATFTVAEVEEAHRRAVNGPHPLRVGALAVECPVRRRLGEVFDYEEMQRVAAFARKHEIGLHLDGARLFLASAYTGAAPAAYAALFDTVYVSLYKYFNAGTGAVLAGPRGVIEAVAHARKVFGGGLYQAWPYAAVALHYLEGFAERFGKAVATARDLFARLGEHPRFRVEPIPHGTNIIKLHVADVGGARYQAALRERGVLVRDPGRGATAFVLTVNESLNRRPAAELARAFVEALPG